MGMVDPARRAPGAPTVPDPPSPPPTGRSGSGPGRGDVPTTRARSKTPRMGDWTTTRRRTTSYLSLPATHPGSPGEGGPAVFPAGPLGTRRSLSTVNPVVVRPSPSAAVVTLACSTKPSGVPDCHEETHYFRLQRAGHPGRYIPDGVPSSLALYSNTVNVVR